MKMKFSNAVKIFLISMCCMGLLITVFSLPWVKNVQAQMETEMEIDLEDLMESIQESIQEDVKQTTKQQVRQETTEVITETEVESEVAETGEAAETEVESDTTTTSCDLTGTWVENDANPATCTFTQSGSSVSGTCTSDDGHSETISATLTDSSACIYSYTRTETYSDEFGSCTETFSGSADLSSDGNSFSFSDTLVSHSGTASGCGDGSGGSGSFTKQ